MRGNGYTIFFAALVCVLSSASLTLVSKGLAPYKKANVELDRKRNVLKAFGLADKKAGAQEINAVYSSNVREYRVLADGQVAPESQAGDTSLSMVYKYVKDNRAQGYAIPISGYGLWSWMFGYLALESDLNTVKGITFYQHAETPGLGGEIEADWFQGNFPGKKICNPAGNLVSVRLVKGKANEVVADPEERSHCVDGISGATMTSAGVTDLIRSGLQKYEAHFAQLRKGVN